MLSSCWDLNITDPSNKRVKNKKSHAHNNLRGLSQIGLRIYKLGCNPLRCEITSVLSDSTELNTSIFHGVNYQIKRWASCKQVCFFEFMNINVQFPQRNVCAHCTLTKLYMNDPSLLIARGVNAWGVSIRAITVLVLHWHRMPVSCI